MQCALATLIVGTSCEKDESSSINEKSNNLNEAKALGEGAFTKKMNFERKCPSKGKACEDKISVPSDVVISFESAILNGSTGLKNFYTTGPWQRFIPNLDTTNPDIYRKFLSGDYEAIRTVENGHVVYSFGASPFVLANTEYLMITN